MIDPHVHLRDKNQRHKETILHGLEVAYRAGLDAVFEMPNTDPALTSRETIEERLEMGDKAISELGVKIFHGVYAGITKNPKQIKDVVGLYEEYFPRVVGLKMFASHSTGNMGIIEEKQQRKVYKILAILDYKGVLVDHCEKEALIKPYLWNPNYPITHNFARSPEAEIQSIKDQIKFAQEESYKGTLHIAHISVPDSLFVVENARSNVDFNLTCEVTPHHCILHSELMDWEGGLLLKMNPPLRNKRMQEEMLNLLLDGRITYIATDHAPHTIEEKVSPEYDYMSGIPSFPYYPRFINFLRELGMSEMDLDRLIHDNIVETFGIPEELIPNTKRAGKQSDEELKELIIEYEFNPFSLVW